MGEQQKPIPRQVSGTASDLAHPDTWQLPPLHPLLLPGHHWKIPVTATSPRSSQQECQAQAVCVAGDSGTFMAKTAGIAQCGYVGFIFSARGTAARTRAAGNTLSPAKSRRCCCCDAHKDAHQLSHRLSQLTGAGDQRKPLAAAMPHREPRRVPGVAPCPGSPDRSPTAGPAPRSHPHSPAAGPSPLSSCTMPMVPPVLMTSTRASVLGEEAGGQPGRSWRRGPARALSRERVFPAASIPYRRIRDLPATRTTGSYRGGRAAAGPPLPATPGAGRAAVPARPGSAREGQRREGSAGTAPRTLRCGQHGPGSTARTARPGQPAEPFMLEGEAESSGAFWARAEGTQGSGSVPASSAFSFKGKKVRTAPAYLASEASPAYPALPSRSRAAPLPLHSYLHPRLPPTLIPLRIR